MIKAKETPPEISLEKSSTGTWTAPHIHKPQIRSRYRIGSDGNAGFNRVERIYRASISDLLEKRKLGMLICILAWIIPMSAFYAAGSGLDWIKRGASGIKGK
jgi:hypothetical protein